MAKLEKLAGGFINQVFRADGVVVKQFTGDELVGQAAARRIRREKTALARFGGEVAPRLLGWEGSELLQEYVGGQLLEGADLTEEDFGLAGRLLRQVHQPVGSSFSYVRRDLEVKWQWAQGQASELLDRAGIEVEVKVDWAEAARWRVTRVHRDFWFGNIIKKSNGDLVAVDWEFSGIGLPYEDFAIVDLWIVRELEGRYPGCRESFWAGYGVEPDGANVREFLKAKCVEFLATTTVSAFLREEENGFYHNKINLLKQLV